jgi:hypothetical protein
MEIHNASVLTTPELRKRTTGRPTHRCEDNIVACRAVSRHRLGKNLPATNDTHATIDVLLETVSSTRSVQRNYKDN